MKQGVIIGFLGKTQDRFSEYQQPVGTLEKLQIVKEIEGFDGVEMVFPYETGDPAETRKWMDDTRIEFCSHQCQYQKGSGMGARVPSPGLSKTFATGPWK